MALHSNTANKSRAFFQRLKGHVWLDQLISRLGWMPMISKPTLGSNVAQNKTFSEWIVELFFDLCASYATGSKDDRPSALTPPAFGAGRELQIAVFRHHQLCVSARTFCLGYTAPVWRWIRLKSTVENGCSVIDRTVHGCGLLLGGLPFSEVPHGADELPDLHHWPWNW